MDRIGVVNPRIQAPQAPVARRSEASSAAVGGDRFMSSDMAQMLEDLAHAESMLKASALAAKPAPPATPAPAPLVAGTDLPTAVAAHAAHEAHGHHEEKAHKMTAGHLLLEAGEMVAKKIGMLGGHSASHGAAEAATHGAAEAKSHFVNGLVHTAEASGALAAGLLVGGVVGSAVIGVGMGVLGAHQLKEGVQQKDAELLAEGTGAALLGARSGLAAVSLAGHSAEGVLGAVAHGAHALLAPIGVVHGAIDTGLGVHKVVQGVKEGDSRKITLGTLGTGFGVALIASAVGGGLPAVAAAGTLLAVKVGYQVWSARNPQQP